MDVYIGQRTQNGRLYRPKNTKWTFIYAKEHNMDVYMGQRIKNGRLL